MDFQLRVFASPIAVAMNPVSAAFKPARSFGSVTQGRTRICLHGSSPFEIMIGCVPAVASFMYSSYTFWPALRRTDLSNISDVEQATIRSTYARQKHRHEATVHRFTDHTNHLRRQVTYSDVNRRLTDSDALGSRGAGRFLCCRCRTL